MIIIIGLAMLAFILGDIFGSGGFFGAQQQVTVGEIEDVEVDAQELEQRAQYWSEMYANGYNQQISSEQARNIAWQDLVKEKVLMRDIAVAGFSFSEEEFDDIRFGEGALEEYTGTYVDENGQFDPERVKQTYSFLFNERRDVWEAEKERLEESRLTTKYRDLISKSLIATDIDATDSYASKQATMDLRFVVKRFNAIPDSTISITDSELNAYFNAHRGEKKYEQNAGRDLELVVFDVSPTEDDVRAAREDIADYKDDFMATTNDSMFVVVNSDTRAYAERSYVKADLDSTLAEELFAAAVGDVIGPKEEGERLTLMKVVGDDAKETATVRHILLMSDESNDAEIKGRADSLLKAVDRGADFESLVEEFTEDPGSKETGGKYEDFPRGQMVPEFESFSFDEPLGATGVVKTTYGYHVIENLERNSEPMRTVVELVRNIEPSSDTFNKAYDEANAFAIDNNDLDAFRQGAEERGYEVKPANSISPSQSSLAGVSNARQVVTWAYDPDNSAGDVSTPIELDDKFIVAAMVASREDGPPMLSDVEESMRTELMKDKKAEQIKSEFGTEYSSLDEAAQKVEGTVQTADAVALGSANLPGGGREPKVVGTAWGYSVGDVLLPIQGANGVYVVEIVNKAEVAEGADIEGDRSTAQQQLRNGVTGLMERALNESRGVQNDISRYY